jgi:hypothetical protein
MIAEGRKKKVLVTKNAKYLDFCHEKWYTERKNKGVSP